MPAATDLWSAPVWVGTTVPTRTGPRPSARGASPARPASRAVTALLVPAVLYLAVVAYGTVGNRWYTVVEIQSGSMRPTIEPGQAILVTRPPDVVRPGMVLVLQVDGRVVTHRVVRVHADGTFVTQGDANRAPDDFTGADLRVVGQYRATLPLVGRLTRPR